MELTVHTTYDTKALTALAKALRKTVRVKSSRVTRLIAWSIILICLLLIWCSLNEPWSVVQYAFVIILLGVISWKEDALNAFFALRKGMPDLKECTTVFSEDHFETSLSGVVSQWAYSRIIALAETDAYLVLILSKNQGHICEKSSLDSGSIEALRSFLEEKTGLTIQRIRG
ncbi:YcxB family protein [uncultured Flavonifractor sp.]|uniref:YcxB family protein n=1 Tax=uncultured Flavonifractor sp. TaxID=1193534 RepID=UPI0026305960|nr:YcxB family protein [uncultured Flavonifractor sp.]